MSNKIQHVRVPPYMWINMGMFYNRYLLAKTDHIKAKTSYIEATSNEFTNWFFIHYEEPKPNPNNAIGGDWISTFDIIEKIFRPNMPSDLLADIITATLAKINIDKDDEDCDGRTCGEWCVLKKDAGYEMTEFTGTRP